MWYTSTTSDLLGRAESNLQQAIYITSLPLNEKKRNFEIMRNKINVIVLDLNKKLSIVFS